MRRKRGEVAAFFSSCDGARMTHARVPRTERRVCISVLVHSFIATLLELMNKHIGAYMQRTGAYQRTRTVGSPVISLNIVSLDCAPDARLCEAN